MKPRTIWSNSRKGLGRLRQCHHDGTPENPQPESDPGCQEEPAVSPDQSADAVTWAQLCQKLSNIASGPDSRPSGLFISLGAP